MKTVSLASLLLLATLCTQAGTKSGNIKLSNRTCDGFGTAGCSGSATSMVNFCYNEATKQVSLQISLAEVQKSDLLTKLLTGQKQLIATEPIVLPAEITKAIGIPPITNSTFPKGVYNILFAKDTYTILLSK